MFQELPKNQMVAGFRQSLKAIRQGRAVKVYVASDIDPVIYDAVEKAAKEASLPIEETAAKELGKICGIDVPTAAAVQVLTPKL